MPQRKRNMPRNASAATPSGEAARLLDKAMREAGIPPSDRGRFMNWTVTRLWDSYKTERMNRRIIIDKEIKALRLQLPNGTVNKDYSAMFTLPLDRISAPQIEGLGPLGLACTIDAAGHVSLSGKPVVAGDYKVKLRYSTVEGEPQSEISIPVAFNPDPRTLWEKEIPTDPNIPYYKPDTACIFEQAGVAADGTRRKNMLAASVRGRSHGREGKPRDDHFTLCYCEESDWYVMAVADGAGSAQFSRKGAEVACETAVDHCRTQLYDNPAFVNAIRSWQLDPEDRDKRTAVTSRVIEIIYRGAVMAHEAVKRVASENPGTRSRDFATTLMFAICRKFDFGWFIATFWVGDGALCLFDAENKTAKLLGTPDEGEYSGQTRFLTMADIFHDREIVTRRMRMAIVPDFTALFLMTDGVSDPMFETERNLNSYARWEEFYKRLQTGFPEDGIGGVDLSGNDPEAADQLLGWLRFWSPGNHDDRTLAMLY